MTQSPPKKSDLGVRTLSAIVMLAVAGGALWAGGWWWTCLVAAIALGVLWEWRALVIRFETAPIRRAIWLVVAFSTLAMAALALLWLRQQGVKDVLVPLGAVVATDIGAYFAGRTFGGPKLAPSISPSKTWSGLAGGMVAAGTLCHFAMDQMPPPGWTAMFGMGLAIAAQAGDFAQSWLKRRAGVKDSGKLIPGHGGLFDRTDGMLSVFFLLGLQIFGSVIFFA